MKGALRVLVLLFALGCASGSGASRESCSSSMVTMTVHNRAYFDVRLRIGSWTSQRTALGGRTTTFRVPRYYFYGPNGNLGVEVVRGGRRRSDAWPAAHPMCDDVTVIINEGLLVHMYGTRMER